MESESEQAERLYNEGRYSEVIKLAGAIDEKLGRYSVEEKWAIRTIECQLKTGDYEAAVESLDASLIRFKNSIRLRRIGSEVRRFSGDDDGSAELLSEIETLATRNSWRYKDLANQLALGRYFLSRNADAKEVLDLFYYPVRKRYPTNPEVFRAIADLAFSKQDYALAAENYSEVLQLLPADVDAMVGLAKSFLPSDSEKVNELVNRVLAINPSNVEILLLLADQQISSEDYDKAIETLEKIQKVHPQLPRAWAYRSVIAHLQNQPQQEGEFRERAFAGWLGNPEVDHLIGRELSEKYRFSEGEEYQRRALVYDENFLPAKIQLAHDLLRLGQELEGWKLADEVFDEDQYSVVAYNLVTLRDEIAKFKTLERDGFVVRMGADEAAIYGDRVLELLVRAKADLCTKYDSELETPVFVEIFPRQQDFAIRTFGLPGGSGFLGVCFGRVITMNSPAAQGVNLTSWESVLWHEFCHVVTLQKTKNKMPRWLSEGISVHEEKLADSAWGETMGTVFREMVLSESLTPVSELSGAFLRPPSPVHLQFAYYESSLVVEYLIQEFGLDGLKNVLQELAFGTPINDALRRHCAPIEFIDKSFAKFALQKAEAFAPTANWDKVKSIPDATAADWKQWNQEHPNNLAGLNQEARQAIEEERWESARDALLKILEICPEMKSTYPLLAQCHRKLDDPDEELKMLEQYAAMEANSVELLMRLLEIYSANSDWAEVKSVARKMLALNPLLPSPYRFLAVAAEQTQDDQATVESLTALARMDPLDAADVHYRLASALFRQQQLGEAKDQVVRSLERAPRYRAAYDLLLEIVDAQAEISPPVKFTPEAIKADAVETKKESP
ncbi:tetratricopeptide repeat protein [Mariniblastus sp.]|nr:tetratricopeptide repeat protein [Mariniblastus sp.]